jgi:hypothetical protein
MVAAKKKQNAMQRWRQEQVTEADRRKETLHSQIKKREGEAKANSVEKWRRMQRDEARKKMQNSMALAQWEEKEKNGAAQHWSQRARDAMAGTRRVQWADEEKKGATSSQQKIQQLLQTIREGEGMTQTSKQLKAVWQRYHEAVYQWTKETGGSSAGIMDAAYHKQRKKRSILLNEEMNGQQQGGNREAGTDEKTETRMAAKQRNATEAGHTMQTLTKPSKSWAVATQRVLQDICEEIKTQTRRQTKEMEETIRQDILKAGGEALEKMDADTLSGAQQQNTPESKLEATEKLGDVGYGILRTMSLRKKEECMRQKWQRATRRKKMTFKDWEGVAYVVQRNREIAEEAKSNWE